MDQSFWEQVDRAKTMSGEQKMRESLELFDRTRQLMLDGLRNQNPQATEPELIQMLYDRLALNRRLEMLR